MATVVVNDLTLEPKAAPPPESAPGAQKSAGGGGAKSGPELEREIHVMHKRAHERALRLWAH
jgi:hypothetical protein